MAVLRDRQTLVYHSLICDHAGWYYKRGNGTQSAGRSAHGWTDAGRPGRWCPLPSIPAGVSTAPPEPQKPFANMTEWDSEGSPGPLGQAMSDTALLSPRGKAQPRSGPPVHPPAAPMAPPVPFSPRTLRLLCIAAGAGTGVGEFGHCLSADIDSEGFTQGWAYLQARCSPCSCPSTPYPSTG